jgi:hypothetical protein
VAATAALLAAAGCGSSPDRPASTGAASTAAPTPTPSGPPSVASRAPVPSARASADRSEAPAAGSMDQPASSSGSLTRRSFPTPEELGAGWRYAVDPGDAEEGYAGNGTPTLARRPAEIVRTAVPFGCARRTAMPAPEHALEADYTLRGATVIAVRGTFGDAARARSFFAGRAANLRACAGRASSPAIGPLVGAVTSPARDVLASDRTPRSDPWREVAVLDGDAVVLVATQGSLAEQQTRRLARLFRS